MTPAFATARQSIPPDAVLASSAFQLRVTGYMTLRRDLVEHLRHGAASDSVGDALFRDVLGLAIRQARRDARPGDILCRDIVDRVVMAVRTDLSRRGPAERRAILREVPLAPFVRINDVYPVRAPLATVPPLLLRALEPLPPELQYRFLGNALILIDIDTRVIVDVVPNAIGGTT
jgi:hypothetical protein